MRISERVGQAAVAALVVSLGLLLGTATMADAAGKPGTTYALDLNRGGAGMIFKISPTGHRSEVPQPLTGSGVEPFLTNPVGLAVDKQGYLIVAESDGYNPTYQLDGGTYDCPNGCGAVLRINPDNGSTQILTEGPHTTNAYGVLLPPDRDLHGSYVMVVDSSEGLIKVRLSQDLSQDHQSYFPGREYLRGPWDAVRDTSKGGHGDILVTNTGAGAPFVQGPGCPNPEYDGFVTRLSSTGEFKRFYCNSRLAAPRGIDIAYNGTAYVADPLAAGGGQDYGIVLTIAPRGRVDYLGAGEQFSAPSGVGFDYSGKRLVIADEATQGIGGLIKVDALGGDPLGFSLFGQNVIDVAVDRRGARPPLKPKPSHKPSIERTPLPYFAAYTTNLGPSDVVGNPATAFKKLPFTALQAGAQVRFECLSDACSMPANAQQQVPGGGSVVFEGFGHEGLDGRFRVIHWSTAKKRGQFRYFGRFKDYQVKKP